MEEWEMQLQWQDEEHLWFCRFLGCLRSGWQGNILNNSGWKSQTGKTSPPLSGTEMPKDINTSLFKMSFWYKFPFIKNKKIQLYRCQYHQQYLNPIKIFLGFLTKFPFTRAVNNHKTNEIVLQLCFKTLQDALTLKSLQEIQKCLLWAELHWTKTEQPQIFLSQWARKTLLHSTNPTHYLLSLTHSILLSVPSCQKVTQPLLSWQKYLSKIFWMCSELQTWL